MSQKLTAFMLENYAKASSMDLSEWLRLNPPPVFCERKFDGFRVFVYKSERNMVLATRHGRIYSESSHPLLFRKISILSKPTLPQRLIFDAEYVSPDNLHIFDLLRVDEQDTTLLPLHERKRMLSQILREGDGARFEVTTFQANTFQEIVDFKNEILSKGGEGIVVKNPNSRYGEKNSWLKVKRYDTIDCFVTRYESTKEMERTGIPHSWFIGVYNERGEVFEMGKVGTYLKEIDPKKIRIGSVVEIQFQEITEEYKLREPFIIKIREDKQPIECTMTQIKPALIKSTSR